MDPKQYGAPVGSANIDYQTPRRAGSTMDSLFKTPLRTPLEQTSKTPIIDMAIAIESQKENVIPRAKGRSASALHNTLTLQHRERVEKLAAQRAEHEARIHSDANAESEDPLEAWDNYVRWTIDSYPAGQTAESGLVPLLELATRTFFDQRVYAQDVRYLRFWALYANNCEDRRQIFKFLMANEVGTNWATLYEELANVLESNSLYEEADETYRLGIHRRAHPLDRLNRRYNEYQQRIVNRINSNGTNDSGERVSYGSALKAAMAAAKRSMLGTKTDARSGAPSASANSIRGLGSGSAGLGGSGSAGPSSSTASNIKKLAVYQDEDGDDQPGSSAKSGGKSGWDSLGSKVQRQQENKASAGAWAGQKMGAQAKTPGKPGAAPISVFKDSDDEDEPSSRPKESNEGGSRTPRAGLGSGRPVLAPALSETDQLRQNPFLRWDKDVVNGTKPREAAAVKALAPVETKKSKKSKSTSTSAHKSSASESKSKGSASSSSSKPIASSSHASGSAAKCEKHAFPILLLYPHLASLDEVVTSFEGGTTRWNKPSGEVCIEEILLAKRGIPCSSDTDPWAYLDERTGVTWPTEEKKPEPVEQMDTTPDPVPTKTLEPRKISTEPNEPPVVDVRPVPQSSSQERTGSHKRKREGDDRTGSGLKMKPKPREVTQTVTMFTKAAENDVLGMFNGDDSEDSDEDDDDDEEEESEEELSHRPVPPTPSARNISGASHVPATPVGQRPLMDENGEPLLMSGRRLPSVSRSGGSGVLAPRAISDPLAALGTVSATPIRAPLLARVPFEKVNVPGAGAQPASSTARPQVQTAPKPSGPSRIPQRMEVFREEDEDEEAEEVAPSHEDKNAADSGEHMSPGGDELLANGTHIYHALTPITEATEFTRWTTRSTRTPGTASKPSQTEARRDLLGQWMDSRRGSARGSLAPDEEDSSEDDDSHDSEIPKLMVLTDAQRRQMVRDSGSLNVSGSMGSLGPAQGKVQDYVFGPSSVTADKIPDPSAEVGDRSDASSHCFPGHCDKPLEATGQWDRPRSSPHDLSDVIIERQEPEDEAMPPVHEDFGSNLVISDCKPIELMDATEDGFTIPNPCAPVDSAIISNILGGLQHKIEDLPHFVDLRSQSAGGMLEALQSAVRAASRKSLGGASIAKNGQVKIECRLEIAGAPFHVLRKLGEGGYGAVFLADDTSSFAPSLRPQLCMIDPEDSMEIDDEDAKRKVAIKIECPPNAWEFYVLHQLEMRLPPFVLPSLISARKLIAYEDESFLLLHYGDKGTLLDVVNGAVSAGVGSSAIGTGGGGGSNGVDEVLAMFFTIELMRIVEQMHHCRFVHGDIKIDNCLLRLDEVLDESDWTPKYSPSGTGCWAAKGMILIDFGRAIDLSCYPDGQTFVADWEADERDCPQMRDGKPWVYEVDYFGIAAVAHCLLFGKYIEVKETASEDGKDPMIRLAQPLRRYWQGELWTKLFDLLLNPAAVSGKAPFEPVIEELAEIRHQMEKWLEGNSNRAGKNLRGMLKKLELWAMKRNE
ncbi:protein kinase [Tilletia horrida]|uniref:Protein kinase n=1 Tax=Tilletia horrida TaxID=155126 RepID=A0AAN6GTF6_9BASI|nr:protein kinase [Tilletia horrida]KAK0552986.1 protein kinase [Tilletia horrida]KAK0566894.1 protein kinase [Tilletia horrida]